MKIFSIGLEKILKDSMKEVEQGIIETARLLIHAHGFESKHTNTPAINIDFEGYINSNNIIE